MGRQKWDDEDYEVPSRKATLIRRAWWPMSEDATMVGTFEGWGSEPAPAHWETNNGKRMMLHLRTPEGLPYKITASKKIQFDVLDEDVEQGDEIEILVDPQNPYTKKNTFYVRLRLIAKGAKDGYE